VLWDRAPDAMREALALHDQIMSETLSAAQGYEVKTEGDAFMVAFASAAAAVRWVCRSRSA
jgi:adenylate cyclase